MQLAGIARKFLAEPDRRRVLQVRPAGFDDRHELFRFGVERALEIGESRHQLFVDRHQCRELYRRGDDVIARLAHVDVVVWMHRVVRAERLTEDLVSAVGDHLVGVGVGRRPRTGLEDIDHEILVKLAFLDFLRRLLDRISEARLQQPQLSVDQRRGTLDLGQRPDEAPRQSKSADREVLSSSLGARAVKGVRGNSNLAHGVSLDSHASLVRHAGSS